MRRLDRLFYDSLEFDISTTSDGHLLSAAPAEALARARHEQSVVPVHLVLGEHGGVAAIRARE
eukprot:1654241-Pyramimonas_sp.AAC.1